MRPIKKNIINKILNAYSIRPGEFEPVDGAEGYYKSTYTATGYTIGIEWEFDGMEYTGRILAHHADSRGKRVFVDVWEKDGSGVFIWKYRNPASVPLSDAEAIKDLQEQLTAIQTAAQSLKNNIDTIKEKTPAAGRPKETGKQQETATRIRAMLKRGMNDRQIMDALQLSRATYYRRKRQAEQEGAQ